MLDGGADVHYVQRLLRHRASSSTHIYTCVAPERLAAVHRATHPGAPARPQPLPSLAGQLPWSPALRPPSAIVVTVTAGTAETMLLAPPRCQKNELTRLSSRRSLKQRSPRSKTPYGRGFCPRHRLRPASENSVAGDDPVNDRDPSGLNDCGIFSFVCDVGHAVAGGARLAYGAQVESWKIGANFLVGASNAVETLIPNGIQAPAPFCGPGLDVAYNQGVIAGGVCVSALGVLGASEGEAASIAEEATASEATTEFQIAPRVLDQLQDARLGPLQGKLTTADLQQLVNSPNAQYLFDARTGNINIIQQVDEVLLRITTASDEFKIISVGPIRANQVANLIKRGDFIPISSGG